MPEVFEGYAPIWRAFKRLKDQRDLFIGMGGGLMGPISITQIQAYLDEVGVVDREERRLYLEVIQALDDVYREHANRKT